MASADILQYRPQSPSYLDFPHGHDILRSSAYLTNFLPAPRPVAAPAFPPLWTTSPAKNAFSNSLASPNLPHGTVVAANVVSNHAKLHKRGVQKNPRGRTRSDSAQLESDIVLTRTRTPPLVSPASPIDGQRSPSKSTTRDLFKQNIRKLSLHQDGKSQPDTIDLSRTAAENEERSGLDITSSNSASRSQPDLRFPATAGYRVHKRTQSHNSLISMTSPVYPPSMPFTLPIRDASQFYIPAGTRPTTAQNEGSEPVYNSYQGHVEDVPIRSRGATVNSISSAGERPMLKLNTSTSLGRLVSNTQSIYSSGESPVRHRRCTNQSAQSIDATTPKSKTSVERAFTFHSKNKEEPIDSAMRAANIQAARQAFEDRQEAKARKYEEQEQKALDRQNRRQTKQVDRKRRQSDTARTSARGVSVPRSEKFESGGEYERTESRLGHPLRDEVAVESGSMGGNEKQKISRRRAAKGRYFRFLTWLKTKFLNIGRSRRTE